MKLNLKVKSWENLFENFRSDEFTKSKPKGNYWASIQRLEEQFEEFKNEKKLNILEEANKITHGDRNKDYDNPINNFKQISDITTAILGRYISPRDIVLIMIAVKLSRESFKHKRDNLVDICGYSWVLNEIIKGGFEK